jgi:hypothetical protein
MQHSTINPLTNKLVRPITDPTPIVKKRYHNPTTLVVLLPTLRTTTPPRSLQTIAPQYSTQHLQLPTQSLLLLGNQFKTIYKNRSHPPNAHLKLFSKLQRQPQTYTYLLTTAH